MTRRNTRTSSKRADADSAATQLLWQIRGLENQFSQQFNDFKDQISAIREENDDASEKAVSINDLLEKFCLFENHVRLSITDLKKQLQDFVESTDNKIEGLLQRSYSNRLLIYGKKEVRDEDNYSSACDLIKAKLNIEIGKTDVSLAYRCGRRDSEVTRPLVVEFTHIWKRNEVFNKKSALKGTKIVISEFLTSERYKLFKTVRAKVGNDCWTRNGRIVFIWNNKKHSVADLGSFNKIVN